MVLTRRDFLKTTAAARRRRRGWAAGSPAAPSPTSRGRARDHHLRVLMLGGTAFLGPAVVKTALRRGHTVTLFNRGKTNPDLFPDLEKLHGDRDGDIQALAGRDWDVVVDTSAYYPRVVEASAGLLADHVEAVHLHLVDLGVRRFHASGASTRPRRSARSRLRRWPPSTRCARSPARTTAR